MDDIFYWLLSMSISGSIAGVFILLIRRIKRIPKSAVCLLWIIPCIRFVIPVGISAKYSLASLAVMFTGTKTVSVSGSFENMTMINYIAGADRYFPIRYKTELLQNLFFVFGVIWIAGLALLALTWVLAYVSSMREIKYARRLRDNIFISDRTDTPAVFGILHPKIVLPSGFEDKTLKYILLHENIHVKRRDNLIRIIAISVASVHWFNPLAWIFLKAFLSDIELSCDERVLSKLGADRKKDYARALLESGYGVAVFASAFGGARIRTRVENILSFKKMTWLSLVLFTVLVVMIFYVLLTNAG